MRLFLITQRHTFMVTKSAVPKLGQDGQQQHRKDTGAPMWTTQVLALDQVNEGGTTINITTAGSKPEVSVGVMVEPIELEAIPWARNGNNGTAFRAEELRPVPVAASSGK